MKNLLLVVACLAVPVLTTGCNEAQAGPTATASEYKNNWLFHTPGHVEVDSTKNKGTLTLGSIDAGISINWAQTFAGATCTCSDTTAVAACRTAVSSTTLTVYGTDAHVVAYTCL